LSQQAQIAILLPKASRLGQLLAEVSVLILQGGNSIRLRTELGDFTFQPGVRALFEDDGASSGRQDGAEYSINAR
ncbi:MAG: hypothetical protein P4L85_04980, partial [Paludisphaera borealis]|uniref:hypothetical protein n=1 Tax=Paludisphaera borealis TaxID=1387353 RepID=UPI00283ED19A